MRRTLLAVPLALLVLGCGAGATTSGGKTVATTTASPAAVAPSVKPDPKDFALKVVILKQECFGSAGCNVRFRVEVAYTGAATSGTWRVLYKVDGGEDPQSNSFTMTGTQARIDSEESISTPSKSSKVTATVTGVIDE